MLKRMKHVRANCRLYSSSIMGAGLALAGYQTDGIVTG